MSNSGELKPLVSNGKENWTSSPCSTREARNWESRKLLPLAKTTSVELAFAILLTTVSTGRPDTNAFMDFSRFAKEPSTGRRSAQTLPKLGRLAGRFCFYRLNPHKIHLADRGTKVSRKMGLVFGLLALVLSFETRGGIAVRHFSESNRETSPRPRRRRDLRGPSPWWDLSGIKPGLDRKELLREVAGLRRRLAALVPYLDNLEERAVLVEAWHVLDKLKPSRQGRERKAALR